MHTTDTTTKNTRRALKLLAGATAIAVFASACGSDDGADQLGEANTGAATADNSEQVEDSAAADDTAAAQADDGAASGDGATLSGALALPTTVTYMDWEWEIEDAFVSPLVDDTSTEIDDDPNTDYLHVPVTITNRAVDYGISGIKHSDVARLFLPGDSLPVKAAQTWDDWDGLHTKQSNYSLALGAESRVERQWSFPVPAGTDPSTVVFEIGVTTDAKQVIPLAGPAPTDPTVPVAFAETAFGGDYSWNGVDFVVLDSFASLNRGLYGDGTVRPGGTDRRADEGNVFVIVELQADQYSISGIRGVNPGAHEIVTDNGNVYGCDRDAPGLYENSTVVYTASCEVPVNATSYTFQLRTDKCAGGCNSLDHAIAIDPSFAEAFK